MEGVARDAPGRWRWFGECSHRRARRQNGNGEESQADECSDKRLPVLAPGAEQRNDQDCSAHDHPGDAVPAARRPFRDGPPSAGDTECESGRTQGDIHAVTEEKSDQGDSEEQDRNE